VRARRSSSAATLAPSRAPCSAPPPRVAVSLVLATAANAGPHVVFVRVVGDCMEPVVGDGWLIRVDTSRVEPQPGVVVAVHIEGAGNVIGYWGGGERAALLHENPAHGALDLWPRRFGVIGTVTAVVDRPITPAPPPVSLLSAPRSLSRDRRSLKSDRASLASRLEDSESDPAALKSDPRASATVLKMRKK
jgi:hypothetical protein